MGVVVNDRAYDISLRTSGVYTTTTIGFDKRGADPFTYHITDLASILPFVRPGKAVTIAGSVGNDGTTRSQRHMPQSDAPYDDYVQTAHVITSWFDAGDVYSPKVFRKILALARDLSATETIKLYYEKDSTGAWVLIDTLDEFLQNAAFFDPSNIANSARRVRLKIELSRDAGDSGLTPTLLLPLVVSYVVRPDPVYAQQVMIRLQDNITTHDGKPVEETATSLKAFLRACEAFPFAIEYTDRYEEVWDVFITRTEELRAFKFTDRAGNSRVDDVMIVAFREV